VSGSWLKLTWPMFGSQRLKYSNRAVTYPNRTTLEWVCLEGSQLSSGLCLGGSLEGPDSYLCALTARGSVISREDHSRICHLEFSRVTKGYLRIEHYMSVLATREIMRARATLHLSGTVDQTLSLATLNNHLKPRRQASILLCQYFTSDKLPGNQLEWLTMCQVLSD